LHTPTPETGSGLEQRRATTAVVPPDPSVPAGLAVLVPVTDRYGRAVVRRSVADGSYRLPWGPVRGDEGTRPETGWQR
jgi:hypothetical protein